MTRWDRYSPPRPRVLPESSSPAPAPRRVLLARAESIHLSIHLFIYIDLYLSIQAPMLAAMYMAEEKVLVITNDTRDYSQAAGPMHRGHRGTHKPHKVGSAPDPDPCLPCP